MSEQRQVNGPRDVFVKAEEVPSENASQKESKSPFSDPVYKQLSRINGHINRMTKEEIYEKLAALNLDTRGNKEVVKKRLKSYYKRMKLAKTRVVDSKNTQKHYDYLCVIDFEATCEEFNCTDYKHEIIEFPAVLVDTNKKEIVDEFHEYCRPVVHPKLSEFCTRLTGITQDQVNDAMVFTEVLSKFETWLKGHKLLGSNVSFTIVTDGPWDIGRFMSIQCQLTGIKFPRYARRWVNIRKIFSNFYQCKRMSLQQMLDFLGLKFEGRPHCGMDDTRNITRILIHLLKDGSKVRVNERIDLHTAKYQVISGGSGQEHMSSAMPSAPFSGDEETNGSEEEVDQDDEISTSEFDDSNPFVTND